MFKQIILMGALAMVGCTVAVEEPREQAEPICDYGTLTPAARKVFAACPVDLVQVNYRLCCMVPLPEPASTQSASPG